MKYGHERASSKGKRRGLSCNQGTPGYLRIAVKIISPEAMPGSGGEECFAGCGDAKAVCRLARGGGGASDMPGFCAFSQVRKAYRS